MFRPLVHALGRSTGGAMLPSVGLSLNASKAESALDRRWRRYLWESRESKGEYSLCDYARRPRLDGRSSRFAPPCAAREIGVGQGLKHLKPCSPRSRRTKGSVRSRDSESFADDLRTWRGVVSGRAVITLRSVKTLPSAWEIRACGRTSLAYVGRPSPVFLFLSETMPLRCVCVRVSVSCVLLARAPASLDHGGKCVRVSRTCGTWDARTRRGLRFFSLLGGLGKFFFKLFS